MSNFTVRELINKLSEYPKDAAVAIRDPKYPDDESSREISAVVEGRDQSDDECFVIIEPE